MREIVLAILRNPSNPPSTPPPPVAFNVIARSKKNLRDPAKCNRLIDSCLTSFSSQVKKIFGLSRLERRYTGSEYKFSVQRERDTTAPPGRLPSSTIDGYTSS